MNRIDSVFKKLRASSNKAFIPFLTCGYPSFSFTEKALLVCEREGADIVELGIPFSDPLADGPLIQMSSHHALTHGATLDAIFNFTAKISKRVSFPIVFMGYVNPIYHYGMARFVDRAAAVGAQGLICPDLPADEASVLINAARRRNFSTIFLVTPVTTKERLVSIARVSSGFIYYVSLTGTTGLRAAVAHDLARNIARIRTLTRTPVCAGFGISNPRHAREASRAADGVIVGSALIRAIAAHKNERLSLNAFKRALRSFSRAVKKG